MASPGTFDSYFQNLPPLDMEYDFYDFWKKTFSAARKISVDQQVNKNRKKSSLRFTVKDIIFRGFIKTPVVAELVLPSKTRKPPVIIHVHDYNKHLDYSLDILPQDCAHLFLWLRGHDTLNFKAEDRPSPEFMSQSLIDRENYYVRAVYVDVLRSIDMLRLLNEVNCSSIGFYGKNFGAAPAVVAAAYSERVKGLVLDTPSFCNIPVTQNLSTSDAALEINAFIEEAGRKKKQVKKNLTYFDAMNFTPRVECPVLTTVGFRDTLSPPESVFALFNHLRCDKTMEVFPEEGNNAGGKEQLKKSLEWLAETIINS